MRFSSSVTAGMVAVVSCTAGAEGSFPERIACRRAEQGGAERRDRKRKKLRERRRRGTAGREAAEGGAVWEGASLWGWVCFCGVSVLNRTEGKGAEEAKKQEKGRRVRVWMSGKKEAPCVRNTESFLFIAGAQGETRTPTTFVTTTSR